MKDCETRVLSLVLSKPHTLSSLTRNVECSSETVSKYLAKYLNNGDIKERRKKHLIFYNPKLEVEKIEFYELLLNQSIRQTVLMLLVNKECTQLEIVKETEMSNPSISRSLKILVENNIVRKNYDINHKTYLIADKTRIISWLRETNPKLLDSLTDSMAEMFP